MKPRPNLLALKIKSQSVPNTSKTTFFKPQYLPDNTSSKFQFNQERTSVKSHYLQV